MAMFKVVTDKGETRDVGASTFEVAHSGALVFYKIDLRFWRVAFTLLKAALSGKGVKGIVLPKVPLLSIAPGKWKRVDRVPRHPRVQFGRPPRTGVRPVLD